MTIFDEDSKKTANPEGEVKTEGSLSELVGDGKKFATVEDLAKGKAEADSFIEQLKGEMDGLRSDLDQRLSATELLEQIRKEREEQLHTSADTAEGNTTPSLDQDSITSLVHKTIEQREIQQTAEQNLEVVDQKMKSLFGEKAEEVMVAKAKEAEVSLSFIKDVAAKSPKAFFNVLGLTEAKQNTVPTTTTSTVDLSAGINAPGTGLNNWSDFEKLRKESPKEYWSATIQNKLMKAKQEQGDNFGN